MPPLEVKNPGEEDEGGQKDMELEATESTWVGTIIRQLSEWSLAICRRVFEHLHPHTCKTPPFH